MSIDLAAARVAAGHLRYRRRALVDETTTELYRLHPEWEERWGPAGREACAKDIEHNLRMLEAALLMGAPRVFQHYCAWLARLLDARDVPVDSVAESFEVHRQASRDQLPQQAYDAVVQVLDAGRAALAAPDPYLAAPPPLVGEAEAMVRALLAGDRARVEAILRAYLAQDHGIEEAGDRIVAPAMREIGRLWYDNRITPVDEHLASAIIHGVLARLATWPEREPRERRAVLACVEGNLHALGLRIVADALEQSGWETVFLGADVPARDLISLLRGTRVDLVALSLSSPLHAAAAFHTVEALRRELRERCPRIVVGGGAILEFPEIATLLGVDAFPDAATLSSTLKGPASRASGPSAQRT